MKIKYTPPVYSGSPVAYELTNAKITRFSTESIYEGSDYNRSGRKHQMEGTAVLVGETSTTLGTIALHMNRPRGKLEVDFGSGTYETITDGSDTESAVSDSRNAPIPSVQVTEIIGGTDSAAVVSFNFTYFGCGGSRIQRFEMNVSQQIDQNGMCRMTKRGSLQLSARSNSTDNDTPVPSNSTYNPIVPTPLDYGTDGFGSSPDLYRNLVCGKPADGVYHYKRVSQSFEVDSSLRTLTFTVEDQQVYRSLPDPVLSGSASFTYERGIGSDTSLLGNKNFTCSYEGSPLIAPQDLMRAAVEASTARIDWKKDWVQSITVKEPNLFEKNAIELTVVAVGSGADPVDPKVVSMMFTDPHPNATTYTYAPAYPFGGHYIDSVTSLKYDPCLLPEEFSVIVQPNPDEVTTGTRKIVVGDPEEDEGELTPPDGDDVTTPIAPDGGIPNDPNDGVTPFYESSTDYETDTGCDFLETVGGQYEFPFQFKTPTVLITQKVKYVTSNKDLPITWDKFDEPTVLWNQKISVKSASVDATGKPMYAISAVRTARVQVSRSNNAMRVVQNDEAGVGMSRLVYSPVSVASPRTPFTSDLRYSTLTDANNRGTGERPDYVS